MNREAIMNKYVAFLDILGFKNKLGNITQNEAKQYIMQFSSVIYSVFQGVNNINGYIVSDSVILYTDNTEGVSLIELIKVVEKICKTEFSLNGIIIRGAISKGEFDYVPAIELNNLQKQLIVGEAYVDAYLLESSIKTIGINLSQQVYEDLRNNNHSINTIEEKIDNNIHYVFRYITLDFLLDEKNLKRFIKLANESGWLPHYYNTIYFAMKLEKNDNKIEQVFLNIQKQVCDENPSENWRDLDLYIKNSFADGVIDEYKTRFLKHIRKCLK